MLKRLPSVSLLSLVLLLLCSGCSIKEDRSGCPCTLVLNLDGIEKERFGFLTVRAESSDGFLFQDVVVGSPLPDMLSLKVPRTDIRLNVFGEAEPEVVDEGEKVFGEAEPEVVDEGEKAFGEAEPEGMDDDENAFVTIGEITPGGAYIVPEMSECPPLYLYVDHVSATADLVEVPVTLKKNYCRISIEMLAKQSYEFKLGIVGNFRGYDVEGKALPGNFYVSSMIRSGAVSEVSVPRQDDTSLRMQFLSDGGVIREFALGEYIAASGYDWTAEELEDIHVVIDYVRTKIIFQVRDWEKVFEFNVTI